MKKKVIGLALGAMLFALSSSAGAQQAKKIPRIGYLLASDPAGESSRSEPIRVALRELGYIDQERLSDSSLSTQHFVGEKR